jgi:y4mF family transcriptional regulator
MDIIEQSFAPYEIGQFVRQRRLASKMNQKALGQLAGTGTRLISELERGKATLRMDAVNKVLRVFGKTLGYVNAPRENEP